MTRLLLAVLLALVVAALASLARAGDRPMAAPPPAVAEAGAR
jgi:hypothetical protein